MCLTHANESPIKNEVLIIGDAAFVNVKISALLKACDIHTYKSNSLKDLQKVIHDKKQYKRDIVSHSRFGNNVMCEFEELTKVIRSKHYSASIDITDMLPYKSEHIKQQREDAGKEFKISMIPKPLITSDRDIYLRYTGRAYTCNFQGGHIPAIFRADIYLQFSGRTYTCNFQGGHIPATYSHFTF